MGRGKAIFYGLLSVLGATFVRPAWEWFYGNVLQALWDNPGKLPASISGVLTMLAPYQQFMLGVSVGMLIALTIGYWERIILWLRRALVWAQAIPWLWWHSVHKQRVMTGGSMLFAGQSSHTVSLENWPVKTSDVEVRWWPQSEVVCIIYHSGSMSITRHDTSPNSPSLKVSYEVRGRQFFWRKIRRWREMDYVGMVLDFEDRKRAASKASIPAPPSPQGTEQRTPQ